MSTSEAIVQLPFCTCDCGERVNTPEARYLPGHFQRTPEWKAKVFGPDVPTLNSSGRERFCLNCGKQFSVMAYEAAERRYCDRWCADTSKRSYKARNPLQARCLEQMAERRIGLTQLSRSVGLASSSLRDWFKFDGRALAEQSIRALAAGFDIPYEQAKFEAGGVTAEERMAAAGRRMIGTNRPAPGTAKFTEARRQTGEALTGSHRAAGVMDKVIATKRASGVLERHNAKLAASRKTIKARAMASLEMYLRTQPRPNLSIVQSWATAAAPRLGIPVDALESIWRPRLKRLGLVSSAGRKLDEERCLLIRGLTAGWKRTDAGKLKRGFWPAAHAEVRAVELLQAPADEHSLERWWRDHRAHCAEARALR